MTHVSSIVHRRDLQPLRLAWQALWQQTRDSTFAHSWPWFDRYWESFPEQRPRVWAVYSGRELIGLVPLVVRGQRGRDVLGYPVDPRGALACGPIGPNPTATLVSVARHLAATRGDWDTVALAPIDAATDGGRTRLAFQLAGLPHREDTVGFRQIVQVPRHSKRGASEPGCDECHFERYRPAGTMHDDDDPRWDLLEACSSHFSPPGARSLRVDDTGDEAFARRMHADMARAGTLDLCLAWRGERLIAFAYQSHCEGRVVRIGSGVADAGTAATVEPAFMEWILGDSAARGDVELDLGPDSQRLAEWATASRVRRRLRHGGRRWRWIRNRLHPRAGSARPAAV